MFAESFIISIQLGFIIFAILKGTIPSLSMGMILVYSFIPMAVAITLILLYILLDTIMMRLHYAVASGNLDLVKLMLKTGIEVDTHGPHSILPMTRPTPLYYATKNGHKDIVAALLEAGAKERAKAFNLAAEQGNIDLLRIFIAHQTDIHSKLLGNTPLHSAAIKGKVEAAKFLLENRANINAQGECGCTPLRLAILYRRTEMAFFLLKNRPSINAQETCGRTPLHYAAMYGNVEMVNKLLDAGADVGITDRDNKTASDFAIKEGHTYIADMLNVRLTV